ncbi:MAG: FHA domain-containing protein, partial [Actinomycetota bacterium]|nr:FHA domain-containing protein [Actinomycetota bacterium]
APPYPGPTPPPRPTQQPVPQPPYGAPARRPRASLVVDQTNERFDLRPGSNVIGRGSEADLRLVDEGVSRRHVDIQFDGARATIYDLGSTNGTSVNGHEVGSHVLRHGDVLRIGHTRIAFHQEQQ